MSKTWAAAPCFVEAAGWPPQDISRSRPAADPDQGSAQTGQSCTECVRSRTRSLHSCPWRHCHHTRRAESAVTSEGRSRPLSVGCHSMADSGATSMSERDRRCPWKERAIRVHAGQPPSSLSRLLTLATQACPQAAQRHATRCCGATRVGPGSPAFRSQSHSWASLPTTCGSGATAGLLRGTSAPTAFNTPLTGTADSPSSKDLLDEPKNITVG